MFSSTSHLIASSRRTRSSPACSASAQVGVNGLSVPCGRTILASGWLVLNAASNLVASCAVRSLCMLLLSSEYPSPPGPPCALLSPSRSGVGPPLYGLLGSVDLWRTGFAWSLRQAERLAALPAFAHTHTRKSLSRKGKCIDSTPRKAHGKGGEGLSTERKPSGRQPRRRCSARPRADWTGASFGVSRPFFARVVEDVP